jgi:hypothetical protein
MLVDMSDEEDDPAEDAYVKVEADEAADEESA